MLNSHSLFQFNGLKIHFRVNVLHLQLVLADTSALGTDTAGSVTK